MTTQYRPVSPGVQRVHWIDAAKGLAISLMVFGHVLGGVLARNWLDGEGTGRLVYNYIYIFHMPLFFMIGGLLVAHGARTRPLAALTSRFGSIIWPYLLWNVLVWWLLLPLTSPFMSSAPDPIGLPQLLLKAARGELSWFLWTFFMVQALFIALAWMPAWLLLLGSTATALTADAEAMGFLWPLIEYMPFLMFGVLLASERERLEPRGDRSRLTAAAIVFLIVAVAVWQGWTSLRAVKLACSLAGVLAMVTLVCSLPRSWQATVLTRLGVASLTIYLLHSYFQGASRLVVSELFGSAVLPQLLIPTVAAILGPWLLHEIAGRVGMAWLFRLRIDRGRPRPSPA